MCHLGPFVRRKDVFSAIFLISSVGKKEEKNWIGLPMSNMLGPSDFLNVSCCSLNSKYFLFQHKLVFLGWVVLQQLGNL